MQLFFIPDEVYVKGIANENMFPKNKLSQENALTAFELQLTLSAFAFLNPIFLMERVMSAMCHNTEKTLERQADFFFLYCQVFV